MLASVLRLTRREAVTWGALLLGGAAYAGAVGVPLAAAETQAARILLISATDDPAVEQSLGVAIDALEQGRVAYDRYVGTRAGVLSTEGMPELQNPDGTPRYSGVLLTTSRLYFADPQGQWLSGLTDEQWRALSEYEVAHKLRRVSLYSTPAVELGLEAAGDGLGTPVKLVPSPEAAPILVGVDAINDHELVGAWRYPAKVDESGIATPLILFEDPAAADAPKPVAAALVRLADDREQLHFLFSQSRSLEASRLLAPLWLSWLSERKLPLPPEPNIDLFAGDYGMRFLGLINDRFDGQARIEMVEGHYEASWTVGSNEYRGPAMKVDGKLFAAWGRMSDNVGISVYKIGEDGELSGEYRLIGEQPDSGRETISRIDWDAAYGFYSYKGQSERSGEYQGTVRVIRGESIYRLDFSNPAGVTSAVGLRVGDLLVVAFGSSEPFGAVAYDRSEEGALNGQWVRFGYDKIFEQSMARTVQ